MKVKVFLLSLLAIEIFLANTQMAFAQNATAVTEYTGVEGQIKKYLCAPTTVEQGQDPSFFSYGQGTGAATGYFGGATTTQQLAYQSANRNQAQQDLYRCINQMYKFAIVLASTVGVLFLVIAGYLYMSAEGNKESVDKAKDILVSTITSLIILFAGYILLRALNPDLVKFQQIQPESVVVGGKEANIAIIQSTIRQMQANGEIPDEGSGGGSETIVTSVGSSGCVSTCVDYTSYGLAGNASQIPGQNTFLDKTIVDFLVEVKKLYPNLKINEAFPPTVKHASACHYNGTCVDIGTGSQNQNQAEALCKAINDTKKNIASNTVGVEQVATQERYTVNILNEYAFSTPNCGASTNFKTTTGGHIHLTFK